VEEWRGVTTRWGEERRGERRAGDIASRRDEEGRAAASGRGGQAVRKKVEGEAEADRGGCRWGRAEDGVRRGGTRERKADAVGRTRG
jgi:hypothetical protein